MQYRTNTVYDVQYRANYEYTMYGIQYSTNNGIWHTVQYKLQYMISSIEQTTVHDMPYSKNY